MAKIKFPLYFFILSAFFISSTFCFSKTSLNSANYTNQLANQVCNNTSNFQFCQDSIYADPQAPDGDQYVLTYITFRIAHQNATSTNKDIEDLIKKPTDDIEHEKRIQRESLVICNGYYKEAVEVLGNGLKDLDSETFDGLVKYAVSAGDDARKCEPILKEDVILAKKNQDLIRLSEICEVFSKLYDSGNDSLV